MMDKYVVRTPRTAESKVPSKPLPKKKQSTIESLSRVVVVEKIKLAKDVLSVESQNVDRIVSTLRELDQCTPSKEVLLETKIAHIINKLRKHSDSTVQELSRKVYKRWKLFYRVQNQRQTIEVRCDRKTEEFRGKAKKLLAVALQVEEVHPLVETMERVIFLKCERTTKMTYRKLIRTVHMKIKNNEDLKEKVLNGLSPNELLAEVT